LVTAIEAGYDGAHASTSRIQAFGVRSAGRSPPGYDAVMYLDALSFLEDERDAWRPFEALLELTDEQLETPTSGAHGWSGRDLMVHLVAWQLVALDIAKELAVGESSPTAARIDADWEARGGDAVNADIQARWADRALGDVRDEFRQVGGELRGFLTVVPEARWIKNAEFQRTFTEETLDHYDDHRADLEAILAAAAS
jgi:mycothiol maleylpyruvate isomerase-like protein